MNVDKVVKDFRLFILASWDSFSLFNESASAESLEEITNNWLQANWEILVENNVTGVNEFLEVYGNGADCNAASSRICYADKLPTHRIKCVNSIVRDVISKQEIDTDKMYFDGFVSIQNNYHVMAPPFDYVLLSGNNDIALVSVKDVIFDIERI